ncbi:MAG: hypothetical protein PHI87_05505, partial [Candidatus Methanomethylophilus sp.]|nr:hypothetical protein [Methanomethylophilus sp.]
MKQILLFLSGLLLVGVLLAVSFVTPNGVEYIYTEDVMNWRNMGSDTNVEPNVEANIHLLNFWPVMVLDSLCQKANTTENYVYIQNQEFDGMIYGGVTSTRQKVRYSKVRASLSRQAIAKRISAKFDRESLLGINESLYGMYIPSENQISVFEVFQYGNGFGGYTQCNNVTFKHYFESYTPPPPPPKEVLKVQIDTVYVEIEVEVPAPPDTVYISTVTQTQVQIPCNPYWEYSGWVEVAGTWLFKGLQTQYEHDEFVNFHANYNEQNSYDELFYIEAKHGIRKSRWVGTLYGGFIDRLAAFKMTMGHESACDQERFETRFGLGLDFRQYSFYQRRFLNIPQTSWVDEEQRVIMYYPFLYSKLTYFFNDRNKSLRSELELRSLPTKNLETDFQDNVTLYGDVGPNTELFGNGELKFGKYALGFYSKIQPKIGINWYSILNIEYAFYPRQRVIFKYSGTDLIKEKGLETMTYAHGRIGPKLSENTALFVMGQYIEDRMNQTSSALGNKSLYIRKDLGIGITWKMGRLEP